MLDPQGAAIARACASLGYEGVSDVRQGKVFEIELDAVDEESARSLVEELVFDSLCKDLLTVFVELDITYGSPFK